MKINPLNDPAKPYSVEQSEPGLYSTLERASRVEGSYEQIAPNLFGTAAIHVFPLCSAMPDSSLRKNPAEHEGTVFIRLLRVNVPGRPLICGKRSRRFTLPT